MSKIATTIEQSKRLLDAGIDPNSADMCYQNYEWETNEEGHMIHGTVKPIGGLTVGNIFMDFPAWSLSALITLCPEHVPYLIIRTRGKDIEGIFEDLVNFLCEKK